MRRPRQNKAFLKKLKGTEISATLFQGAVRALEELGEDVYHLENRVVALNTFFSEQGYAFQESCRLVKAVEFRLGALMRLKEEHGLLDWAIPKKTTDDASDPYLAAAAAEPLVQHGFNDLVFDPERFRTRLTGAQPK